MKSKKVLLILLILLLVICGIFLVKSGKKDSESESRTTQTNDKNETNANEPQQNEKSQDNGLLSNQEVSGNTVLSDDETMFLDTKDELAYYDAYQGISAFQKIELEAVSNEDSLNQGLVYKNDMYYFISGPYYSTSSDYIFIDVQNNRSGLCTFGTAKDAEITNKVTHGFQSMDTQYVMPITVNEDGSYYVVAAFDSIQELSGCIYIPYSTKNSGQVLEQQYTYNQLEDFQLTDQIVSDYDDESTIKINSEFAKIELKESTDASMHLEYNSNYYTAKTSCIDDVITLDILCEMDNNSKHNVCTPFIIYLPLSQSKRNHIEMSNVDAYIDTWPNLNLKVNNSILHMENFDAESYDVGLNATKSKITLPKEMIDYFGEQEYEYHSELHISTVSIESDSSRLVIK